MPRPEKLASINGARSINIVDVVKPQEAGASRPAPASATVGPVSLLCSNPPPPPFAGSAPLPFAPGTLPRVEPWCSSAAGVKPRCQVPLWPSLGHCGGARSSNCEEAPRAAAPPHWRRRLLGTQRLILGYRNNAVVGHQGPLVLCHGHAVGYPMIRATRGQASGINAADPCAVAAATQGAAPRGRFRD